MKKFKLVIILILLVTISFNTFSVLTQDNSFTRAKIRMSSFSQGERYFGRLSLWYLFAKNNDWENALKLEVGLDQADVRAYKITHYPLELKKSVNNLVIKPNKTVEDWLELARVNSILDKKEESFTALSKAKSLDPIRDDIGQLYYQTQK